MINRLTAGGGALTTTQIGSACGVAGQIQREMQAQAKAYPALFPATAFDPAFFSTISLAMAFSAPQLTAADLRLTHRMTLWSFALDWLIDYVATEEDEVVSIVEGCIAVANGAEAYDDLTRFLTEVRDELATAPAFADLRDIWHEEFERLLRAMTLEWQWKSAARPSFEDYLANAASIGLALVFTTHWIWTGTSRSVAEGREAGWAVERVIRLLNDLASYEREKRWGDLNALMLDVSREQVGQRIDGLVEESWKMLDPLRATQPELADYLARQMEFCVGFYRITDYWGAH
ncbi:terpene synthase family protein [Nonomuraea sp. NPDC050536]|uniref:terpene synthase family protein n=1 Tax=Nonomuraea sp. NPDC050536 TaxID=3364366 RepID=UPI0037C517DD